MLKHFFVLNTMDRSMGMKACVMVVDFCKQDYKYKLGKRLQAED